MSDPHDLWLADAVEAARECARDDSPAALEGAATRFRIHASLERRRGTSKRRLTIISAIVASMFGSTAFAYYSGWRPFSPSTPTPTIAASEPTAPTATKRSRGRASKAFSTTPMPTPDEPTPTPMPVPTAAEPTPNPRPNPSPVPTSTPRPNPSSVSTSTPSPTPTAPRVATSSPTPTTTSAPTSTTSTPRASTTSPTPTTTALRVATPSPPPTTITARPSMASPAPTTPRPPTDIPPDTVPDAELAAYQRAHDAHFRGTDAKRALAAWDAYLAQFPDGKLAPEARYDRALVLVKLGRWADARAALQPFASAPAGAYRQREAAKILDAIRAR